MLIGPVCVVGQDANIHIPTIPLIKDFQPLDYNGGIQNWDIDQDSSGLLFVANNDGVLEFDGNNWQLINVPYSTKVRSLLIDDLNRIHIGGAGQIGYFQKGNKGYDFIPLLERLPLEKRSISEVWNIIEFEDQIFYNTIEGLITLKNNSFQYVDSPGEIYRAFKANNQLIVQIADKGLFEFQNQKFKYIPKTDQITDLVISINTTQTGFLAFTVSGEIFSWVDDSFIQVTNPLSDKLSDAIVNTSLKLTSGDLAIGTQNSGLFIVDENLNLKKHLTKGHGLTNRTVLSLHEDGFNNLWVGLNNGINYVELSSPFSFINEQTGLEGTGYAAAVYQNRLYLGTNNGLFTQSMDNELMSAGEFELVPGSIGQVYNFSKVGGDLILNHHNGAFRVEGTSIKKFHDVGSWQLIETPDENVFLGGNYGGMSLFQKKNGSWSKIKDLTKLKESSRIMAFENDSTLWMTHGYKGAYLLKLDGDFNVKSVDHFGAGDGFPSNTLINVYELNENLIFTGEYGIYDFIADSSFFRPNPFLTKWLGENHVSKIVSHENDIYFIENRELGRLRQKSFGNFQKEKKAFNRINKYLSDDLENITILDRKNLLIGAKEGFIHLDPTAEFTAKESFNVILKPVTVSFSSDSVTTLSPSYFEEITSTDITSIQFQFASPYFDGFEDLEYSYRLSPLDKRWSDWSSTGFKEYNHLPKGNYTFEVKSRNVYGVESRVASTSFQIPAPWYGTNYAYLGYFIMSILLISLGFYFQSKRHSSEKEELTSSKHEALKVKDQQISELSEKSKKEIEELKNEKLKSEIHHKNHQLTSVTMHLINKNEFVQEVRQKIESTIKASNPNTELKKILKTIDKNLSNDDSWEQFAFHFDQVHGDFLKKLSNSVNKLTPQETKLAAYLRMNMTSKEIAHLMNISVRGVELARYRLRKKLKLERDQNLTDFLLQY